VVLRLSSHYSAYLRLSYRKISPAASILLALMNFLKVNLLNYEAAKNNLTFISKIDILILVMKESKMILNANGIKLLEVLENAGFESYFVGGCVRDNLLGNIPHDWDITTAATPTQISKLFPDAKQVGENFGVSLVEMNGEMFEIATMRLDGAYSDNRHPDSIKFTTNVLDDVTRRDFTMNALLMNKEGVIFDLVDGQNDIVNKEIIVVGNNPAARFHEDALRLLRAIRFAARFEFELGKNTKTAIINNAASVTSLPADRINGELAKILTGGHVDRALRLMDETGLLAYILPNIYAMHGVNHDPKWHPEGDVWEHTLTVLSFLKKNCSLTLALAALLHDVGKPVVATINENTGFNHFHGHAEVGADMTTNILRNLRFSNDIVVAVTNLVAQHMAFFNLSNMKLAKLKRFVRQDNFNELLELNRIDSLGSNGDLTDFNFAQTFLKNLPPEQLHPVLVINGNDLLNMGFKAGPIFKTFLTAVENAQLEGSVTNKKEAQNLIMSIASEIEK
jgi:poly(A) polymerase